MPRPFCLSFLFLSLSGAYKVHRRSFKLALSYFGVVLVPAVFGDLFGVSLFLFCLFSSSFSLLFLLSIGLFVSGLPSTFSASSPALSRFASISFSVFFFCLTRRRSSCLGNQPITLASTDQRPPLTLPNTTNHLLSRPLLTSVPGIQQPPGRIKWQANRGSKQAGKQ